MRSLGLVLWAWIAGCWVTTGEVRDKYLEPTRPGAGTGGPTTGTPAGTPAGTPSGTPSDLTCVDESIGSAVGPAYGGTTAGTGNDHTAHCGLPAGGNDLVLQWVAPSSGCFSFDTAGSSYDTLLALIEGDCTSDPVVCNDDRNDELTYSELGYDVTGGSTYLVVLDGPDAGDNGAVSLNIQPTTAVVADTSLYAYTGSYTDSNVGADDTLDPPGCSYVSGADRIYAWTAPSDGTWTFAIDPFYTTFDTVLSLHRQCVGDAIVCDDQFDPLVPYGGEVVQLTMTAGEPIFIRVAGFSGYTGTFRLQIY